MEVTCVEDVRSIDESAYNVGFNDYYETPDGEQVAVPNGTDVPDEWVLVSD